MKNTVKLFAVGMLITFFHLGYSQCKTRTLVSSCKSYLKPFVYDSYVFNTIEIKDKAQKIEVQFSAFIGEKYRFIFSPSEFDEKIKVKIYYEKGNKDKSRMVVYDSSKQSKNPYLTYNVINSGNYYIEYEVPASNNPKIRKGCMVIIIGMEQLSNT